MAIGPVVTCFSMFTHVRVTFIAFSGLLHRLWCRPFSLRSYISISCSVFMERLHHDHVIVKFSAYEMQRTR